VGNLTEVLWQYGFQLFPQQARQNGRAAADDTAIINGERSIIDGMIKLASFGASTTLQKIRRVSQASLTRWFTSSSSVAAMVSQQVSSRDSLNSPVPA
jgi:predicted polyphosphate/ATP-dependent NAD kinase